MNTVSIFYKKKGQVSVFYKVLYSKSQLKKRDEREFELGEKHLPLHFLSVAPTQLVQSCVQSVKHATYIAYLLSKLNLFNPVYKFNLQC